MFYWVIKVVFSPVVKLAWVKNVEGVENIPREGPFIVASNHASYLDFFLLPAVLSKRVYFLAAEKFFRHPLWKVLMLLTNQIRVDRKAEDKSETYKEVLAILREKKILGIFPEGTRSSTGRLQKAFSGVARISLLANVPIVPVGIKGTFEILSRYDRFPKFKKICEIKIGKAISLSPYSASALEDERLLKKITRDIMIKIAKLVQSKYPF